MSLKPTGLKENDGLTKFKEKLSIFIAKHPGRTVLIAILAFNIVFFLLASALISSLSLSGTEQMGFLEAAFCTITMILDAGCISFVVSDIGKSGVAITLACLAIIIIGMISFTGAVIGYITNYISGFIENANAGNRRLIASDHIVILNWNTRASEIINDLMYCVKKQVVVVLVKNRKEDVEKEIAERLTDTINRENDALAKYNKTFAKNFEQRITVIVREGDVFSSKQLRDISLEKARTVIILGDEYNETSCAYQKQEQMNEFGKGNSQTVKTLMQVADITASESSFDDQKVIVEITDDWTWEIVSRIRDYKQINEKCNIVPVRVNKVLGQLLSQFSIMPELNMVYRELLSNKGMSFFYKEAVKKDSDMIREYLDGHSRAIPLSFMEENGRFLGYYAALREEDIDVAADAKDSDIKVDINGDFRMDHKHVIILGHNKKIHDIMDGFAAFRTEWGDVIDILVIDDGKSLERMDYYKEYSFVNKTVAADIFDRELICDTINAYVGEHTGDTSILILSDDSVSGDETDSKALANLVYVQDIILKKKKENPDFDENTMDMIVEIIDPKHHDIVSSYSVNNVVISNRYISKMITQIGEKDYLFDFYKDILTYDTDTAEGFESKEVYAKRVSRFFNKVPGKCTARQLIKAVYTASVEGKEKANPTIVLGYINKKNGMKLFRGNQDNIEVELQPDDLLIVFSNH